MFRVGLQRGGRAEIPDEDAIVIATGGEVLVVGRPFQATDLLAVAHQFAFGYDAGRADVSLKDEPVTAARAEDVAVPGERADPGVVALQHFDHLVGGHVPYLHKTPVSSHRYQIALRMGRKKSKVRKENEEKEEKEKKKEEKE